MNSRDNMPEQVPKEKFDRIRINDISVRCIIGTEAYEREEEQEVLVTIVLYGDFSRAGNTDELSYTVDYSELKRRVAEMVRKSGFQLIEAMADEVAGIALEYEKVEQVTVSVKKPSALRFTQSAEVEITRQ